MCFAAIEDGLQHNLRKLQESETDSVRRITEIERRLVDTVGNLVTNKVDERMDSRLNAVENSVKRTLDRKLEAEVGGVGSPWPSCTTTCHPVVCV